MIKPWSISTTLRNPDRLRLFLITLKQLENCEWNEKAQKNFQILLIQNRLYGTNNAQFINGLTAEQVNLLSNYNEKISFQEAEEIFYKKNYEDPAMRGRQSLNPLKKLGFISIVNGKIVFNDIANRLIDGESDIGEIFLKCFIKWQIPNFLSDDYKYADGYDVIPFIATLQLFSYLHKKNKEFKGLSKEEFCYFIPTLINYKDIEKTANRILEIRHKTKEDKKNNINKKEMYYNYISELLGNVSELKMQKFIKNLFDYGDNIIRYFRLTRFFYLRGNGYYVDLEPRRLIEISELCKMYDGSSIKFNDIQIYYNYLKDENKPELPWVNKKLLYKIATELIEEIKTLCSQNKLDISKRLQEIEANLDLLNENIIKELRNFRTKIQDNIQYLLSQQLENLKKYIIELKNIDRNPNKALELEKLISYCLFALNDAINIKPNYPVGDDNQPIFFAPANKPDIECYYKNFNSICEVTMLKSRDQWFNEGQPVMRHLRDFELFSQFDTYCLFIAPILHRDTLNTFWIAVKYEYEGKPQKIIPLTIAEFIEILEYFIIIKMNNIQFTHENILELFSAIILLAKRESDVISWRNNIHLEIKQWFRKIKEANNGNK